MFPKCCSGATGGIGALAPLIQIFSCSPTLLPSKVMINVLKLEHI